MKCNEKLSNFGAVKPSKPKMFSTELTNDVTELKNNLTELRNEEIWALRKSD